MKTVIRHPSSDELLDFQNYESFEKSEQALSLTLSYQRLEKRVVLLADTNLCLSTMSDFCVTLVLKTNIYKSKLIVIQHFASFELKHYEPNTDFIVQSLEKLTL